MINQERLKNFLIELIKIDSLSRQELNVALRLKRELEDLGATVSIDDAGAKVGGNVGNLLAKFPGYEADDIIATLCERLSGQGCELVVVSSDKDLMQLVTDGVKLLDSAKDRWIGKDEVKEKFGVAPEQVIEVMGLMGDAVDNIPGVKGIGEKTAGALIQQFQTLENLFAHLDEMEQMKLRGAARIRQILEAGKDMAFLSRDLATVKRDVPLYIGLPELEFTGFNVEKARTLFTELEFTNLIKLIENGG